MEQVIQTMAKYTGQSLSLRDVLIELHSVSYGVYKDIPSLETKESHNLIVIELGDNDTLLLFGKRIPLEIVVSFLREYSLIVHNPGGQENNWLYIYHLEDL